MEDTKKSGFATAALVLGIIGICTSFIPIINNAAFFAGALAVIFGIIALIKKAGKVKTIIAIILGILAIILTLNAQKSLSNSLNKVGSDLNKITGNSTEEILAKDVDVVLGKFEVKKEEYTTDTKLKVKVTNKTAEKKSFQIQVEAVGKDGSRLGSDYIYANNLTAGQSQNFEIFTYVESNKISEMKNAKFKIVEVSMF